MSSSRRYPGCGYIALTRPHLYQFGGRGGAAREEHDLIEQQRCDALEDGDEELAEALAQQRDLTTYATYTLPAKKKGAEKGGESTPPNPNPNPTLP